MITSFVQLDPNKKYTYADYLTWQFKERVELILGKIFKMSPAPKTDHQIISMQLSASLSRYLQGKYCKVFAAPFDVRIAETDSNTDSISTVVQPDISVICDATKIDENGCLGAPDLIVEILSDSTVKRDLHEKYELYERVGVREYWIVHPRDKTIIKYTLDAEGVYQPSRLYTLGDVLESHVLQGYCLSLDDTFEGLVREPDLEYERSIVRL